MIVKTHPIDNGAVLREPEHSRLRVAGLSQRRDSAYFDKPKSQCAQGIQMISVLVEPCSQPNGIGKLQAHHLGWQRLRLADERLEQPELSCHIEPRQRQVMSSLRWQPEQQFAHNAIHTQSP